MHSVFDCVFGSPVMSHQAGKAVAGWKAKIADSVAGGQPPTFDDIEVDDPCFPTFRLF